MATKIFGGFPKGIVAANNNAQKVSGTGKRKFDCANADTWT